MQEGYREILETCLLVLLRLWITQLFLLAGRALRARPAGPKIAVSVSVGMCVRTYHVCNNYVCWYVRPHLSRVQ